MTQLERSVSPQVREGNTTDDFSLFPSRFPWSPRDTWREPRGAEKELAWAGPLLLSWAGLLGWRELMASRQRCRETALPRSSSSAKGSRAEGTACRCRGEVREVRERLKAVGSVRTEESSLGE